MSIATRTSPKEKSSFSTNIVRPSAFSFALNPFCVRIAQKRQCVPMHEIGIVVSSISVRLSPETHGNRGIYYDGLLQHCNGHQLAQVLIKRVGLSRNGGAYESHR